MSTWQISRSGAAVSIAVIIPTYNSAAFIRQTLASVLAQTLLPEEILINDDASTDGTPEIVEEFLARQAARTGRRRPQPALKIFRRGGQRQAASRNYAASQTSCEWIAFLDHDDLWEPHKLARQRDELDRTGADLCYTSLVDFREINGRIELSYPAPVPPAAELEKALYHSTTFLPSSVVVRRQKFLENGGFALGYTIAEDWELWLRLYRAGLRFAACQEPLFRYRIHSANQSRNAMRSLQEAMEVYERLVVPQLPAATRRITFARTRAAHQFAAALALRHNGDPRQIAMLLTSLATFPFDTPHRYKVLAHMVYTRLKALLRPAPVPVPAPALVSPRAPAQPQIQHDTAA